MHLRTYPNTPLWFDLALATGAIALAYWLDQVIHADRRSPRPVGAFAPEERERADHEDIDREEGAIGRRASQEPHSWQLARAEQSGRGRSASSPLGIPVRMEGHSLARTRNKSANPRRLRPH
jgi:hypothetical protein